MAFPTIPTTGNGRIISTVQANTTATRTFPDFSGLTFAAGDLLIALVFAYQSSTGTNAAFSNWSGSFTEFGDYQAGATYVCIGAAYKWATGSESGTITVTQAATVTGHAVMVLMAISGAHATTPPEFGGTQNGVNSAAGASSLDPAGWDVEDTLWVALAGIGETSTGGSWTGAGSSPPTNFTDYYTTGMSGDVVGAMDAGAAFRQIAGGAIGYSGLGNDASNARWSGAMVAVRPVPSFTGSGGLTAPAATAAGTGTASEAFTGTGTLTTALPAAAGSGTVEAAATSGPPLTPLAQPAGLRLFGVRAGHVQFGQPTAAAPAAVTGTGSLTSPAPTVAGSGFTGTATSGPPVYPIRQAVGGRAFWARAGQAQASAIPAVTAAVSGTGTLTSPATAAAGSGSETFTGTGSLTAPAATASGSGSVIEGAGGSGGLTIPAPTAAGSGTEAFTATGTLISGPLSASGTAAEGFTGSGGLSAPAAVLAGSGTVSGEGTAGSGGLTSPALTASGTGLAGVIGSGPVTLPAPSLAGSGAEEFTGTGALASPALTMAGSGNVIVGAGGSGGLTIPAPTAAGSGTEAFTGTGTLTSLAAAASGAGTTAAAVSGTGSLATPRPTAAGTGSQVFITGSGALTAPATTVAGTGLAGAIGAGTFTVPVLTLAGTAVEAFTGSGGLLVLAPVLAGVPPPQFGRSRPVTVPDVAGLSMPVPVPVPIARPATAAVPAARPEGGII